MESIRPTAENRSVRLVSTIDPYLGKITGDPGRPVGPDVVTVATLVRSLRFHGSRDKRDFQYVGYHYAFRR